MIIRNMNLPKHQIGPIGRIIMVRMFMMTSSKLPVKIPMSSDWASSEIITMRMIWMISSKLPERVPLAPD